MFLKSASLTTVLLCLVVMNTLEASKSPMHAPVMQSRQSQYPGSTLTVPTTSGLLHGAKQTLNIGNNSVYKFLSVPYAEPPTGALRFKRPVELAKDRMLVSVDASKFGKTCPQYRHLARFISPLLNLDTEHQTSEDCLHLNIFVPSSIGNVDTTNGNKFEATRQLPVIVWIPGEGFDFADARQFDGSYLAHKTQSIVVTVQYRVGVLGFLSAPQFGITGNMGIHDQIMALRWIRKNIGAFGGDAERTTLMGRFSGSMTISAMITAPKHDIIKMDGQTLFNRVILLSGVAVNDWIIEQNQDEKFKGLQEAAVDNEYCLSAEMNDISCLRNMPVDRLLAIAGYGWKLVIDNELIDQTGPIEAIKKNQFASQIEGVLIGETGAEGTLCLYRHMLNRNSNYAKLIEEGRLTTADLNEIIRDDSLTYFKYNVSESNPMQIALETIVGDASTLIRQEGSGRSKLRDSYLDACSSYMVKSHANRFKRNLLARNQLSEKTVGSRPVEVFHYELKYKPTFSLAPDYIKTAAHGDDIPLIFGLVYSQPKSSINEADLLVTQKMMAYIGNFVHGNHPLLHQHPSIDSSVKTNDNETVSMDESEFNGTESTSTVVPSLSGRTWSSENQVYPIDFNENDYNELSNSQNRAQNSYIAASSTTNDTNGLTRGSKSTHSKDEHSNLRVIVIESPRWTSNGLGSETKTVPIVDIVEQRSQSFVEEPVHQYDGQITRSQRLLELHRQTLEDNSWIHHSSQRNQLNLNPMLSSQVQQLAQLAPQAARQQVTTNSFNESSFMTVLLLSACIVIFALMSFCFVLSLILFRCNFATHQNINTNKNAQQFASSSSSCNICDDSQGGSIDAVLGANKKDNRGFCNVFAKLRNHNNPMTTQPQTQLQCTTSTSAPHHHQQTGNPVELVLHQRVENGTNHQQGH